MSCCGMPAKSDEPEYRMSPPVVSMVSGWEKQCPGILMAVHQEIATGDWDRNENGFVPPYSLSQEFAAALATLERFALVQHIRHQHKSGPWYIRWGLVGASHHLPSPVLELIDHARSQVRAALDGLAQESPGARPQDNPTWSFPGLTLTFNGKTVEQKIEHP